MNQAEKISSPYGVSATSVLKAPEVTKNTPLAPFEERTLNYLVNQFKAASPRIQAEFLKQINDIWYVEKIEQLQAGRKSA